MRETGAPGGDDAGAGPAPQDAAPGPADPVEGGTAADPLDPPGAPYAWDLPPGFPPPLVPADNPMSAAKVSLGEGYIKEPFRVRDGYLDLPAKPGLGVELDENALASKIGHDWRSQESYDADDGSVVDW